MFTIPAARLTCVATSSSDCCPSFQIPAPATPRQPPAQQARARRLVCAAESTQSAAGDRFDVGAAVINPAYRSTPWEAEAAEEDSDRTHVRLLHCCVVPHNSGQLSTETRLGSAC